jgi:hypothetical protein
MSLRSPSVLVLLALAPACDVSYELSTDTDAGEVDGSTTYVSLPLGAAPSSVADPPSDRGPSGSPVVHSIAHFGGSVAAVKDLTGVDASPATSAVAIANTSTLTHQALGEAAAQAIASAATPLVGSRRFFVHGDGLLVAHSDQYDSAWSAGPASLHWAPGSEFFSATRPLELAALPARHRALLGDTVRVYSENREVCVATVSGFTLAAELIHGPGIEWNEAGEVFDGKPLTYTAEEVFDYGIAMLKAELTPVFGDCSTGVWADLDSATRPLVYGEGAAADAHLTRRALQAWHKTALYRAIDRHYSEQFSAEWPRPAGRWEHVEGTLPLVQTFVAGSDTLVVVSADSWQGCGGPGERGLVVFRQVGDTLEFVTGLAGDVAPQAWVDIDRDGRPEAIYKSDRHTSLVGLKVGVDSAEVLEDLYQLTEPLESVFYPDLTNYGCGC